MNQRLWRVALSAALCLPALALAHSGGTDANGCHRDRKNGGRHCHGRKAPALAFSAPIAMHSGAAYYPNCAAARAAGAAPVRLGDPGYSTRLDRDRDGVGCE